MSKQYKIIIDILEKNGYKAYIVGGCVRDKLLGIIPHDYDICTDAHPDETIAIFKDYKVIETGLKHGTVTVIIDNEPFEVTTFRTDGQYSDNRHPDNVNFVKDIKSDLSRRDFTINAMAYNHLTGYEDPFNGTSDLKNKIIKCVGDPDLRFKEDALRILRAIRFAVRFNFSIEENTFKAMLKNKESLKNISAERICSEFSQIITNINSQDLYKYKDIFAVFIPEIKDCFGFKQYSKYHTKDVFTHTCDVVEKCEHELVLRLAAFFHDIGKPHCFSMDTNGEGHFHGHYKYSQVICIERLKKLRFDKKIIKDVSEIVYFHDMTIAPTKASVKRILNKIGPEQFKILIKIKKADMGSHVAKDDVLDIIKDVEKISDDVLTEKSCFKLKDLNISGKDFINAGIQPGPLMGKALNYLLNEVIDCNIENEKQVLVKEGLTFIKKNS